MEQGNVPRRGSRKVTWVCLQSLVDRGRFLVLLFEEDLELLVLLIAAHEQRKGV
jgi:hypothetical protein